MLNIVICEDQQIVRDGLKMILNQYDDIHILNDFENGKDLVRFLESGNVIPEVILMDIDMPILDGYETTKIIRREFQKPKILILSTYNSASYIENAIQAGAHGYLDKESSPEDVYIAILEVNRNGFFFNQHISYDVLQNFISDGKIRPSFKQPSPLNEKEIAIIKLICQEKTASEIADELHLGENTINSYKQEICRKLGIRKSIGLVIYAIKEGYFIP